MTILQKIQGPRRTERNLKSGRWSQAPGKSNHVHHSVLAGDYLSPEYQPFKIQSQHMVWRNRIISIRGKDNTKSFIN